MKYKSLFILMVFFACSQSTTDANQITVYRVSDGKTISFGQMAEELKMTQLVFVGETHNQEPHHRLQLDIIKILHASKKSIAAGFEMCMSIESTQVGSDLASYFGGVRFLDVFDPLVRPDLSITAVHRPALGGAIPHDDA